MNELIKVTELDGKQLVSSKQLYKTLGLASQHYAKWYEKNLIYNDFAIESEDYTELPPSGRSKDFAITIEFAKKIAMMTRTEKGEVVRNYFIECEKTAKDLLEINPPKRLPQTYSEALRELADVTEKKLALEERNEKLEPRSKYFEQMILTDGLISMEQTAKLLNIKDMGRNNLFKALRNGNIIQKHNTSPKQYYVDKGYFELKEEIIIVRNIRKVIVTTYVTQKGLAFIFKFFGLTNNSLSN